MNRYPNYERAARFDDLPANLSDDDRARIFQERKPYFLSLLEQPLYHVPDHVRNQFIDWAMENDPLPAENMLRMMNQPQHATSSPEAWSFTYEIILMWRQSFNSWARTYRPEFTPP